MVEELHRRFGPETPYRLMFTIGGQIGIDCAPCARDPNPNPSPNPNPNPHPHPHPHPNLDLSRCGWDKTFCLNFLPTSQFPTIHFFGDKTLPGGGDYELYSHARTVGHAVGSPEETLSEVRRLFL